MTEIITGTERAAQDPAAAPEPRLTISELHALLRDAAALERASRPIVLHTAPMPVPAVAVPPTAAGYSPRHPGVDIAIPAPPEAGVGWAVIRHPAPARRGWGVPLALGSMGALVVGAASGVVVGTAAGPVGICVGGIVGAVAGTARAVHEQNRGQ